MHFVFVIRTEFKGFTGVHIVANRDSNTFCFHTLVTETLMYFVFTLQPPRLEYSLFSHSSHRDSNALCFYIVATKTGMHFVFVLRTEFKDFTGGLQLPEANKRRMGFFGDPMKAFREEGDKDSKR